MPLLFQRTETENKQPASIGRAEQNPSLDWRIIGIFILTLLFIWLFLYAVTWYSCYTVFSMCIANSVVLWSVPIILVIGIITFSSVKLIGVYHESQRKRLANAIDEHYDYRNVDRVLELKLLDIAHRLAESYGTAEVDTLSTTNNSTNNSTSIKSPDEPEPDKGTRRNIIPIDRLMDLE